MLQVHAYDWNIKDTDDGPIIHCWALDNQSKPYLLIIDDFPVFCMIELPLINGKKWDKSSAKVVIDYLSKFHHLNAQVSSFIELSNLYYYQGSNKTPYIRAFFTSLKEMKRCKYKLDNVVKINNQYLKLNMWEDQISVVRKLLTIKNIRYSKWFEVRGQKVDQDEHISTLDYEYRVDWRTMKPIDDQVCKEWVSSPGVLSWDIECYSHNHLAMPNKYNDTDVAYMISAIYKRYKDKDSIKRYGIVIGDCNDIPDDQLKNNILIRVKDEVELIEAFGQVIKETDPEILVGYNIFNFDYPYLNHRLLRQISLWPKMGRLINDQPKMTRNNFNSKAYGHNAMNTLSISGRISIDLLPVVKRDYKLESNTLNYVCKKFIGKEKYDVSPKQMFKYYEELTEALKSNDEALLYNARAKMTEVMLYCIQDAELVIDLMEYLETWIGLIELSNIAGVTILEIFMKGQQIRCLSQIYDLAANKGYVINGREAPVYTFKGGSVQKPIPGLYENIICLDFKSLYPSIMQACNICYTTLIHHDHYDLVKDEDCHVIEFDQEMTHVKDVEEEEKSDDSESDEEEEEKVVKQVKEVFVKHYKMKFYKHKEGLIPELVRKLVADRNAVRRQQKGESEHVKLILEKRQLAIKISANAIFGFFGVQEGGKLPCMENAMSITAKGRELIASVAKYLKDTYDADIVYGDSVTHDTPILVRHQNMICYKAIEELGTDWIPYYDKESSICPYEVWSDEGWTKIKKVIRHCTDKNIYRVKTDHGVVDVTSDHSLLDKDKNKVKPSYLNVGDELLHTLLPDEEIVLNPNHNKKITQAYLFYNLKKDDLSDLSVKSIQSLGHTIDYVYDLETTNHHFAAGIGHLVVHNTDSVMVDLKIKDRKECQYWGERLAQEISGVKVGDFLPNSTEKHLVEKPGLFLKPLEMEFEKAMLLFCIKPKMYAAYLINKRGDYVIKNGTYDMLTRGIPLVRRDKIMLLKSLYKSVLDMIMQKESFTKVITLIIDTVIKLINNEIDYGELSSSRELNAFYKQPSFYMKIFSDELKRQNKIVTPGERLSFVVIKNDKPMLGQKMMLVEDYIDKPLPLDYMYYLEKALANPIDTIVSIGYANILSKLQHIQYHPSRKRKPITLSNPVEMMYYMVKDNIDLKDFKGKLLEALETV